MADPRIKVPANLIPVIEEIADYYGIPFYVLAATVQLGTSWTNNVDASFIAEVAQQMFSGARDNTGGLTRQPNWLDVATDSLGGGVLGFRKRLGDLVQEKIPSGPDFTDEERWTYDKENPAPTSSYIRPKFGPVGGQKVVIGTSTAARKFENRAADIEDVANLFERYLGRAPKGDEEAQRYVGMSLTSAAALLMGSPEAATWRQYGEQISQARRWADSLALNLTGQPLTNDQMRSVVENGWNPGQLEAYLRSQKFGNTDTTIGAVADLREAMNRAFQKVLGRDPTEGEVNFAVVNKVPTNHAEALAEQTRDKTVWAGDPEKFTTARSALRQIMAQSGIIVAEKDVDAALVNQAVNGKWTADQMRQAVVSGQMPGAPAGTTVDRYTTTKDLADSLWKTYFPTQTMPQPYINTFLNMTPDQITTFIRNLPSPEAAAIGTAVPVGVYNDAKNVATQALAKLGVVGRDPTPQEVAAFSTGKLDVEAIARHYSTDPGVLAQNPGAQYGLTRQDYYKERSGTEEAYAARFGGVSKDTLAKVGAKAKDPTMGAAPTEPDWLKEVFREGYSAQQAASIFDDFFRRTGAPPSAQDIDIYNTRSRSLFSDESAIRAYNPPTAAPSTATGQPTFPGLGSRNTKRRVA